MKEKKIQRTKQNETFFAQVTNQNLKFVKLADSFFGGFDQWLVDGDRGSFRSSFRCGRRLFGGGSGGVCIDGASEDFLHTLKFVAFEFATGRFRRRQKPVHQCQ